MGACVSCLFARWLGGDFHVSAPQARVTTCKTAPSPLTAAVLVEREPGKRGTGIVRPAARHTGSEVRLWFVIVRPHRGVCTCVPTLRVAVVTLTLAPFHGLRTRVPMLVMLVLVTPRCYPGQRDVCPAAQVP